MLKKYTYNLSQKITIPANEQAALVGVTDGREIEFASEDYDASQGGFEIEFRKGVTFTGGVPMQGTNRNTFDPTEQTLIILAGATITDAGQLLRLKGVSAATTPQSRLRASSEIIRPWLLEKDTAYALIINNLNSSPITLYAALDWNEYELL